MAYRQGLEAKASSPIGGPDQPIHGSGLLPEGEHEVVVKDAYCDHDGKVTITLMNDMGDIHRYVMWVWNNLSDVGNYSATWRNWLASVIPDLEAITQYKSTRNISGFIGAKLFILLQKDKEGFYLKRDGDTWAAFWWPDKTMLTDWLPYTEMMEQVKNMPKSYPNITRVEGRHHTDDNIRRYCEQVYHTAASEMEAQGTVHPKFRRHST